MSVSSARSTEGATSFGETLTMQHAFEPLRQSLIGGPPVRGHRVVRFVDDQPVRPAGARAQLANASEQRQEEPRTIVELHAEQVDDGVLVRLVQQLHSIHRPSAHAPGLPSTTADSTLS